ncbi:MAG: hypothetical protein K2H64_10625 [Desulfovibrio sp.]|nr:hypothetical protein [Desulfovibrio sp.]
MRNDEVKAFGLRGKGYRFRDNNILKNLKAIHMLSAIAWGGGAFAMQALHLMRASIDDNAAAAIVASCSYFIDTWVVMPGLLGCLLTGLFYSIFTAIGFFRFLWIIYKWIITLNACVWGLTFWSSLGDKLIQWLSQYDAQAPLLFMRSLILPDSLWAIVIQTAIILSMCLISVYRPLGWWHKYCLLDHKHIYAPNNN